MIKYFKLILFFSLFSGLKSAKFEHDQLMIQNQKYLKFAKVARTQIEAQDVCRSNAGKLAQFPNKTLQDQLLQVFSQQFSQEENTDIHFWIGLSKTGEIWKWLDGSDVSIRFNPSDSGQCAVVEFKDFSWKPYSCKRIFSFICEHDAGSHFSMRGEYEEDQARLHVTCGYFPKHNNNETRLISKDEYIKAYELYENEIGKSTYKCPLSGQVYDLPESFRAFVVGLTAEELGYKLLNVSCIITRKPIIQPIWFLNDKVADNKTFKISMIKQINSIRYTSIISLFPLRFQKNIKIKCQIDDISKIITVSTGFTNFTNSTYIAPKQMLKPSTCEDMGGVFVDDANNQCQLPIGKIEVKKHRSFCEFVETKISLFDYTQSEASYQLKILKENRIIKTLTSLKEVFLNLTCNSTYNFLFSYHPNSWSTSVNITKQIWIPSKVNPIMTSSVEEVNSCLVDVVNLTNLCEVFVYHHNISVNFTIISSNKSLSKLKISPNSNQEIIHLKFQCCNETVIKTETFKCRTATTLSDLGIFGSWQFWLITILFIHFVIFLFSGIVYFKQRKNKKKKLIVKTRVKKASGASYEPNFEDSFDSDLEDYTIPNQIPQNINPNLQGYQNNGKGSSSNQVEGDNYVDFEKFSTFKTQSKPTEDEGYLRPIEILTNEETKGKNRLYENLQLTKKDLYDTPITFSKETESVQVQGSTGLYETIK